MVSTDQPLVSIVTPVYNGEKYLAECIESVLAQTYRNWDYTIINNCSTDRSLVIVLDYARKDPRIKVYNNEHFVGTIENHNIAFRSINPDSKYCKMVHADDWIYPECVSKLVDLAERYPNAGIVGSYTISVNGIRGHELPLEIEIFDGRHICRLFLLGLLDHFFLPSTVLYRSSLVRSVPAFFPEPALSADVVACLNCLKANDFGFVHQILSFQRIHDEALSARLRELHSYWLDRIVILKEFGPIFLTNDEHNERLEALLSAYYHVLAVSVINFRNKEFWNLHRKRLKEIGYTLYDKRLTKALCLKLLDLFLNPRETMERILKRVKTTRKQDPALLTNEDFSKTVDR